MPRPLELFLRLSRLGNSPDDLKALDQRLRALNIPVPADVFVASKAAISYVLVIAGGVTFQWYPIGGVQLMILGVLMWKMPYRLLDLLEKRRREELKNDFTFMVSQVRIYARAADLYQALKIVPYALKGRMGKELRLLSADMEMSPMAEALDSFAKRCGFKEVEYFTQILSLGITLGAGADVDKVLSSYARVLHQRRVGEIKRWIKLQPILMTILPALLLWLFMLMFIMPMYTDITNSLRGI